MEIRAFVLGNLIPLKRQMWGRAKPLAVAQSTFVEFELSYECIPCLHNKDVIGSEVK